MRLLPLVLVAACHKKEPEQPAPLPPPPVEEELSVVSVSPSALAPGQPSQVAVYGSGFSRDMAVSVGGEGATAVTYRSGNQLQVSLPPLVAGTHDLVVTHRASGVSAVLRGGLRVENLQMGSPCSFVVLYFETDQSQLTNSAVSTLTTLVNCYNVNADPIRVEGHADERGTTDYNLALSFRRALAVQTFLIDHGVDRARLPVSSFGEERPAIPESNEAAWARNRRVELTLE